MSNDGYLEEIEEINRETSELKLKVSQFDGAKGSIRFMSLESDLIENIKKLDLIDVSEARGSIRRKKRDAIKQVTQILELLEEKASEESDLINKKEFDVDTLIDDLQTFRNNLRQLRDVSRENLIYLRAKLSSCNRLSNWFSNSSVTVEETERISDLKSEIYEILNQLETPKSDYLDAQTDIDSGDILEKLDSIVSDAKSFTARIDACLNDKHYCVKMLRNLLDCEEFLNEFSNISHVKIRGKVEEAFLVLAHMFRALKTYL